MLQERLQIWNLKMEIQALCDVSTLPINPKAPPASSKPTNTYVSVLENEENFFEGMLAAGGDHGMQNSSVSHQLPSSSPKQYMSTTSVSTSTTLPIKRLIPSQYWNSESIAGSSIAAAPAAASSGKRFHGDLNSCSTGTDQDNTSFVSLLSQLPQGASFHPNTVLGSLGDGILRQQFQLPTMNWNS